MSVASPTAPKVSSLSRAARPRDCNRSGSLRRNAARPEVSSTWLGLGLGLEGEARGEQHLARVEVVRVRARARVGTRTGTRVGRPGWGPG